MNIPGDSAETGATVSPWRGAGPELVIAGVVIVVAAAVGYLLAGWAGLSVAVTAGAAAAMVVLRYLLPTPTPDATRKAREKPQARLLSGYSHRRFVVHSAIASRGFYQGELRPVLEHLLAARLAERHGVHLYQDPDAARRLLCQRPRDADLWAWIDPESRPETPAAGRAHPAPDGGPPVSGPATGPAGRLRAAAGAMPMRAVAGAVAMRVAAVLLGAGSLVWAALPAVHRAYAGLALALAIAGVAAGGLRLALAAVPVPEDSYWPSPGLRVWRAFLEVVRQVPWEEGAVIGIVWLEVLHPSRPWHTAVLGAGLIAYLLIAHLAESDAPLATLRPQARVLGLGAALLALGAGAGMLPAAGPGAGSALLRLVAAGALIVAAGLVLPYVSRRLPRWGGGDSVGIYNRRQGTTQRRAGPDG